MPAFWLVIPAAGIGSRMQSELPKQYLTVHNHTILEHTLNCFIAHPQLQGIIVSVAEHDAYWPQLNIASHPKIHRIDGGQERAHSVLNALNYLLEELNIAQESWVLVHDAARPNLQTSDLNKLLIQVSDSSFTGGLLATPAKDTLKVASANSSVSGTLDRSAIWLALTPQMFPLGLLTQALNQALDKNQTITDESSAMELAGFSSLIVEGASDNLKITYPEDLAIFTAIKQINADSPV